MNPLEILESIVAEFSGIDKADLQTAELNICNLLVGKGLAEWRMSTNVSAGEDEERIVPKLPTFQPIFLILSTYNGEEGKLLGLHHCFDEAKDALADLTIRGRDIQRTNNQMRIKKAELGEYDDDGF